MTDRPTERTYAGPSKNGAALWAMVLGAAALVLSPAVIGGVLGLAAMILGIVGVTKPDRKGMAVAGIVLGPISMLIGVVALAFWAGFFLRYSEINDARRQSARVEISNLTSALETFEIDNGRYPSTGQGLQSLVEKPSGDGMDNWVRYVDKLPVDPWGHPYIYRMPGRTVPAEFDLLSAGPDGVEGTADDIDRRSKP